LKASSFEQKEAKAAKEGMAIAACQAVLLSSLVPLLSSVHFCGQAGSLP
jgi:hypothetical protein